MKLGLRHLVIPMIMGIFISTFAIQKPSQAASASEDFNAAVKILQKRGFSKYAILAILQGRGFRIYENSFPVSVLEDYERRYGVETASVMVYTEYAPNTGEPIQKKSLVEVARTVDKCMANNRPWRDCTLNYHPVDGCYLTASQRKQCVIAGNKWAKYQTSGEWTFKDNEMSLCWNYEKGPGIVLPYQVSSKSQLDLSKAKRKDSSTKKANTGSAKKKVAKTGNFLGRPVCVSAYSNGPSCLLTSQGC